MELRLLNKTSRLRIGTLALETGGSRRAPQLGFGYLRGLQLPGSVHFVKFYHS